MCNSLTVGQYSSVLDGDPAAQFFSGNCSNSGTLSGSVFNNYSTTGLGNYSGYSNYGYNSATTQMLNNMTPEEYIDYQTKLQKKQMTANSDIQKASTSLQFQSDGVELQMQRQSQELNRVIKDNKQDEVMDAYNKLTSAVKEQLKASGLTEADIEKLPEDQLKAYVERAYQQTNGTQLIDDLDINSDSGFVAGLKDGAVGILGLTNGRTASKNLADITGTKEDNGSKVLNYAGAAVGGAATGAAVGAGIGLLGGPFAPITSTAGAAVGAVVGAVGGLLTNLIRRNV